MNDLDKSYCSLLEDILNNGVKKQTRNGETLSVFGRTIRHKMSEGFPLLTTKKMYWKGIVTELLWFLKGDTNIKYLVDNDCHIWDGDAWANYSKKVIANNLQLIPAIDLPKTKEEFINKIKTDEQFAKTWGELGPVYGKQWRSWSPNYGHKWGDQISTLINELKTNPDSRRMMVSAWNVGELDQMTLPPCHYGFQVYTRELSLVERMGLWEKTPNKDVMDFPIGQLTDNDYHHVLNTIGIKKRAISLMWNQRSVDTFLGLPFNIASYGLLLEFIAKEVGMIPDELIGNLGDTHLYSEHINAAKEQILRTPYKLPKLNFNSEWWDDDKSFFESVKSDYFCKCLLEEDIQLYNYESHPIIKAELKN